jgi:chromosome segregation and condensation protein ScpB
MESNEIKKILESLLFIAEQPVTFKSLEGLFENQVSSEELEHALQALADEYRLRDSALEVKENPGIAALYCRAACHI